MLATDIRGSWAAHVFAADIGGGWGLLFLLQILEVVLACCACYIYRKWLRPAVLATYLGGV